MQTTFAIAVLRAKHAARQCMGRAAGYLVVAGVEFVDAVRFVLAVLRSARGVA
jgi:hypothetical protein